MTEQFDPRDKQMVDMFIAAIQLSRSYGLDPNEMEVIFYRAMAVVLAAEREMLMLMRMDPGEKPNRWRGRVGK